MERPTLQWIESLARQVGQVIVDDGKKAKNVSEKMSISDVVTESDTKVEHMIRSAISERFPTHRFFGEETTHEELTDEPTWIVDPIDGTTNFVHTFPLHATSIAYCEAKSPVLGVVFVPNTGEMFSAERGRGAYLNGERLSVSPRTVLQESLISTGFHVGYLKKAAVDAPLRRVIIENTLWLIDHAQDIRRTGACSVDLAYVAAGRLDGFVEIGPHEWDFAAGILLVTEAGGSIAGFAGNAFRLDGREIIAAGTSALVDALSRGLQGAPIPTSDF